MTGTSSAALPGTAERIGLVSRGVWLEILRRKEFYVLLILVALFCLAAFAVSIVGISNPATATLLLNMGLTLAAGAAHLLTLVTAARQIPSEIDNRTLYPLLAKPLERSDYFLGKWAALSGAGFVVFIVLLLLVWISVPKMEEFSAPLFVQMIALQALSLGLMAAAGLTLSLWFPNPVVVVILGLIYAFGGKLVNMLQAVTAGGVAELPVQWLTGYVPSFSDLNLVTRFTDGIAALTAPQFVGLCCYAMLLTAVAFWAGFAAFKRRPL